MKTPPIEKIQVVPSGLACDTNGGFTKLALYNWPGTVDGCFLNKEVTKTPCSSQAAKIPAIKAKSLYTFQGMDICVRRNKKFYYTATKKCTKGYQLCNSNLCVGVNENCPISEVKMELKLEKGLNGYNKLSFGDYNLFYKVGTTDSPLINFVVNFGIPCIDEKLQPFHKNTENQYILLNINQGCGTLGNQKSSLKPLVYEGEEKFQLENGLRDIMDKLTGFEELIKKNAHSAALYSEHAIPIKSHFSPDSTDLIKVVSFMFKQNKDYIKKTKLYGWFAFSCAAIQLVLLIAYCFLRNKKDKCILILLSSISVLFLVFLLYFFYPIANKTPFNKVVEKFDKTKTNFGLNKE